MTMNQFSSCRSDGDTKEIQNCFMWVRLLSRILERPNYTAGDVKVFGALPLLGRRKPLQVGATVKVEKKCAVLEATHSLFLSASPGSLYSVFGDLQKHVRSTVIAYFVGAS